MNNRSLGTATAFAILMLVGPAASHRVDDAQRIVHLERENEALKAEVRRLEGALIALNVDPKSTQLIYGYRGPHVMELEEVRPYRLSEAETAKIESNTVRIADLRKTIEKIQKEQLPKADAAPARQLREQIVRIEREIRDLETGIERLRAAESEHFWLLGWDGVRDIMLRTRRPNEAFPRNVRVGQFVTWEGDMVDSALGHPADSDFATFIGDRLSVAVQPSGYQKRPPRRTAVWDIEFTNESPNRYPNLPGGG